MEVMSFSERHGYKNPPPVLKRDDLPDALRNRIWDVLWKYHFRGINHGRHGYSTIFDNPSKHSDTLQDLD